MMQIVNIDQLLRHFESSDYDYEKIGLDFSNPLIGNAKITSDWLKLYKVCDALLYSEIVRIVNQLLLDKVSIVSILLVGSVARGLYSEKSDVDIIVILNKKVKTDKLAYKSVFRDINIVYRLKKQFHEAYLEGKEFFIWAIKYGLLLFDKNYIVNYYQNPINKIKKDEMQNKFSYINIIVPRIYDALLGNDLALGRKYIKKLIIQTARIILISKELVPKSRPELDKQLDEIQEPFSIIYNNINYIEDMNKEELSDITDSVFSYINNYLKKLYTS
ncbi:nucleotidyltransferase domain-containing protein [Paenibacillus sp. OAS669]|uniref:nucleotidyltransferase domain-containing protein n=1 Tax=Paenibacillus sp. OAS669 TaxID=2663821 RepID=UPI00178993A9|nr:nucleotidyltransferase domain-containing protein [Paenibacillus sp. OAS669]MBE1446139.1 putative nucleotidyltransferase [Paenibacillus sp. OAS669]